jgi:hypothetical protein
MGRGSQIFWRRSFFLKRSSPETAPSKRIANLFTGYEKPLFGALAAMEIGLETIRQECPHFNDWLNRLETLPATFSAPA